METYQKPTVTTYTDPDSLQTESGMTGDELVKLAEENAWQRREVAGRWWVGQEDYRRWLAAGRPR